MLLIVNDEQWQDSCLVRKSSKIWEVVGKGLIKNAGILSLLMSSILFTENGIFRCVIGKVGPIVSFSKMEIYWLLLLSVPRTPFWEYRFPMEIPKFQNYSYDISHPPACVISTWWPMYQLYSYLLRSFWIGLTQPCNFIIP